MTSRYPRRFSDDGTDVTVDVHGCSVDDALSIIERTAEEAFRRGRARVVVVHGTSSADRGTQRRTIKTALQDQLSRGVYEDWVTDPRWSDDGGQCTLWIKLGPRQDAARIKTEDVVR